MRKNYQKMEVSKFLYFALVQFQFDAIYCMISLLTAYTSLFTSRIGQMWSLARLNDVRGISMLSAKIVERRKQVTARYKESIGNFNEFDITVSGCYAIVMVRIINI